ncbi:hypothetical protein NDU88_009135 [Pleurodeles waltl]|uniref:Uncharacterized protein n=1 Tax=Pleurodeles waltl TaxID=8319 RepID=A0AAV7QTS5_PLEWA|nr:hypothetical protein NDU88_009135 [Pleurodeles waltl]
MMLWHTDLFCFYADLCGPRDQLSNMQIIQFLSDLPLKALSLTDRVTLDEDLTPEEITTALGELQSGKTPGLNGFPCEFFKLFANKLDEPQMAALTEAADTGALPPDFRRVEIVVIFKLENPQTNATLIGGFL